MKRLFKYLLALLALTFIATPIKAQYTFFTPEGSFAIEVSLQNSPYKRLPIHQNAITSLSVVGDNIVGGTSAKEGLSPYIFVASLSERKLTHKKALNKVISGQEDISSGFCKGKNDVLYAGSIPKTTEEGSGHLIKVKTSSKGAISIFDLGVPIKGEGIFSLTCDGQSNKIYGISYPSGLFFSYDINSGKISTYRKTAATEHNKRRYHHFALEPQDYLAKDLIVDNQGRVYGSKPMNKIFYYSPKSDSITVLEDELPSVWGRHVLGRVDSWAKSKDGTLYGGNSGDGQLFKLNPSTGSVKNMGKPIMMNRLRALNFAKDGNLYGVSGAKPGYAHLFRYEKEDNGFVDLGNPQFPMETLGIEQGISWRGFQIASMTTSEDGKYVVMGEYESLSQLMVFPVTEN